MSKRSPAAKKAENARKRFSRTMKRLEQAKEVTENPLLKAQYQKQLNQINSAYKATYAPKGGWKKKDELEELEKAIRKGDKITTASKQHLMTRQAVKNFNFQRQIRWASSDNMASLSYLEPEEVKAFYRVTEPIWKGIDPADRNKAILRYFKTRDMETAFFRALSKPDVKKRLNEAITARMLEEKDQSEWTDEEKEWHDEYQSREPKTGEGSPIWSMEITEFDTSKSWKDNIDGEVEE